MAFSPISFIASNYRDYKNNWLKAYEPGTTTPKSMATDSTLLVLIAKAELNKDGFIISAGGALIIPYIDGAYDLWLFPTEAEADANDTSNALRVADNVLGFIDSVNAVFTGRVLNSLTLLDSVSNDTLIEGDAVNVAERTTGNGGGAMWDVVLLSSVTPNTFNIVVCTGVPTLALVLREEGRSINALQYGAIGDWNGTTGTDNTLPIQAAADNLPDGGKLLYKGRFLHGDIKITAEKVRVVGDSLADEIVVLDGSTGIWFTNNWCAIQHLSITSQGDENDGLGTTGVLIDKEPSGSRGFCFLQQVNFEGFSGAGFRSIDSIDVLYQKGYIKNCINGIHLPDDGVTSFGTTVDINNVYFSSCERGINARKLFRSHVSSNSVFEFCDYGIYMDGGTLTVRDCYFENNNINGLFSVNAQIIDDINYKNGATDNFDVTFTGAVAASDRGKVIHDKYDILLKSLTFLAGFGVDELTLKAIGNTNNLGLKYNENTVALVRGDNIFDNAIWENVRASEFKGWDVAKEAYRVDGVTAGDNTYGIEQDITLDDTKTYILDVDIEAVQGSGIDTLRFGSQIVTSGVPFTPDANGLQTFKAFGSDPGGTTIEHYIYAITVAEVVEDAKQLAQVNARLTTEKNDRGTIYLPTTPTTGSWSVGERIYNSAPTAGGFIGWVCTTQGKAATTAVFKTFGAISA